MAPPVPPDGTSTFRGIMGLSELERLLRNRCESATQRLRQRKGLVHGENGAAEHLDLAHVQAATLPIGQEVLERAEPLSPRPGLRPHAGEAPVVVDPYPRR